MDKIEGKPFGQPANDIEKQWLLDRLKTLSAREAYQLAAMMLTTGRLREVSGKEGDELLLAVLKLDRKETTETINCLLSLSDYQVLCPAGGYEKLGEYYLRYEAEMPEAVLPYANLQQIGFRYKEWASRIYIPPDKSHNLNFVVPIRSAVLNGVVDQYRAAYQALGLFSPNQCEPDSFEKLDYEGKVLVLSPDTLKESCWKPENQLWYAHDGFGCSPTAIGRSIRCTCLNDEEMARWNRTDFTGVLKEEFLPDWAREKLQELKLNKLQQMSRSEKEQALAMRINLAWDRYEMSLQTLSVSEVIDQIADVSAVWMCRDALLKDMELYSDEQLIFLLSLFDPLDQMRDHLAQEQEADQMEQVNDAIRCLQKELQESQKIKTPGQGGMSMK